MGGKRNDKSGSAASERDSAVRVLPSDPITGPAVLDVPVLERAVEQVTTWATDVEMLEGKVRPGAKTAAVILAGGRGERFNGGAGKQLVKLLGRPMLTWTAEIFDAVADVGLIVIVAPEDQHEAFCHEALDPYPFVTPIALAPSGSLRQESAFAGVCAVDERFELIAMHDGARPLATPELVEHTINTLKGNYDADGTVVGYPSIDTLKYVTDGEVVGTPDRSLFWVVQTPQVFRADVLREAHMTALAEGFVGTDDSSLVERLGRRVLLVRGPRDNLKLTVPEDRLPIEAALRARRAGHDQDRG